MQPLCLKSVLETLENAERVIRSASKTEGSRALEVAEDLYALGVALAGDAIGDTDGDFFSIIVVR